MPRTPHARDSSQGQQVGLVIVRVHEIDRPLHESGGADGATRRIERMALGNFDIIDRRPRRRARRLPNTPIALIAQIADGHLRSSADRLIAAPSRMVFSGPPPVPRTLRNSRTFERAARCRHGQTARRARWLPRASSASARATIEDQRPPPAPVRRSHAVTSACRRTISAALMPANQRSTSSRTRERADVVAEQQRATPRSSR